MLKIAAIIPAYNEEKSITEVVNSINAIDGGDLFSITPVVINDCSTDSTEQIIAGLKCTSLNLPVNLGIGGAVQSGFKFAFENSYDYAVQIDGDGQHPAHEVSMLLQAAIKNNADVVIGSRFIDKKGYQSSTIRRFGINYFKHLNKWLVGVKVTDSTSGFRLINKKVLNVVNEYYPDEYPEPEAIILYALNHFKIIEVPVTMRERQGGISSIGFFSSIYYMFKVSLAIIYTFIRLKFKK